MAYEHECRFQTKSSQTVLGHRHINPDGSAGGWVAETARVDTSATVEAGAVVLPGAVVGKNAVVRDGAFIAEGARVPDGHEVPGDTIVLSDDASAPH